MRFMILIYSAKSAEAALVHGRAAEIAGRFAESRYSPIEVRRLVHASDTN